MIATFEEMLKRVPDFGLTSSPVNPGAAIYLDLRAPMMFEIGGAQCGLANAGVATVAVTATRSHRMLIALGQMLSELVQSPPEEIADRMREIVRSLETIGPHFIASTAAINEAVSRAQSRQSAPTGQVH